MLVGVRCGRQARSEAKREGARLAGRAGGEKAGQAGWRGGKDRRRQAGNLPITLAERLPSVLGSAPYRVVLAACCFAAPTHSPNLLNIPL